MGQIANQMALELFFKIKEQIKEKKKQKQANKNNHFMDIQTAKQIRIADYLHSLGYSPVKQQGVCSAIRFKM